MTLLCGWKKEAGKQETPPKQLAANHDDDDETVAMGGKRRDETEDRPWHHDVAESPESDSPSLKYTPANRV